MLNAEGIKGQFLEYKGRPLVYQDPDIYYGDLSLSHHVCMLIMTTKVSDVNKDEKVPDKIMVQLLEKQDAKISKQFIADGLTEAFETADVWLSGLKL